MSNKLDKRYSRPAFGFETRMIHAGTQPEPVTGSGAAPAWIMRVSKPNSLLLGLSGFVIGCAPSGAGS